MRWDLDREPIGEPEFHKNPLFTTFIHKFPPDRSGPGGDSGQSQSWWGFRGDIEISQISTLGGGLGLQRGFRQGVSGRGYPGDIHGTSRGYPWGIQMDIQRWARG
jgi:hypothetical protein